MTTRSALSRIRIGLFAAALCIAPRLASADGPRILVSIEGLRSDRGEVRGALFSSAHGWTEAGHEIATCRARIHAHHATCVIEGVGAGRYAFAFLHDENGNGALDRDFLGWPQEGFGFSNDAAPSLGPPSFDAASFEHDGVRSELDLHARYGL